MRVMIYVGNEGPTDLDFKDGDIFAVYPNSWEPGAEELKRFFVVEMSEYGGDQQELVSTEYALGPSPDQPQICHMRKYYIDYPTKLTAAELESVRDRETSVPVMSGRFILDDINRK